MNRILAVLLFLPFGLAVGAPAWAAEDPPYVEETVAAWRHGPVHLSPGSGAITPAQAAALADRIEGWRDDVFLAVVPAKALGGDHGPEGALAFLDAAHEGLGRDGVFVVMFSGAATYGAAYGTDDRVGSIVADQVAGHTLGQGYAILGGTLDGLGAPGGQGADGGSFPGWAVGSLVAVLVAGAVVGAFLLGRHRRRPRSLSSGEVWATRRPSGRPTPCTATTPTPSRSGSRWPART